MQVVQEGTIRSLFSGTGFYSEQSAINVEDLREHMYDYSLLAMRGLDFIPEPSRILVVGLGGGIIPRELRHSLPDAEIDIIEIDEHVIDVAKDFFFFEEDDKMKVHHGDAFIIVQEMKEQYDFIVVDAFLGNYTPFPLMSVEFLECLYKLSSDKSILTLNCSRMHPSFNSQINTFRSVYGDGIHQLNGERNDISTTLYVTKGDFSRPAKVEITEEIENAKIFTLTNP